MKWINKKEIFLPGIGGLFDRDNHIEMGELSFIAISNERCDRDVTQLLLGYPGCVKFAGFGLLGIGTLMPNWQKISRIVRRVSLGRMLLCKSGYSFSEGYLFEQNIVETRAVWDGKIPNSDTTEALDHNAHTQWATVLVFNSVYRYILICLVSKHEMIMKRIFDYRVLSWETGGRMDRGTLSDRNNAV